jgi:hypothetical protein
MNAITPMGDRRRFASAQPVDPQGLHRDLAHWNHRRLTPELPGHDWEADLAEDHAMRLLEGQWVESLRAAVAEEAAEAPTDPDGFVAWFEDLKETGAGQHDPLFPFLAEVATLEQMRWFLTQEAAGEAGFDDLVAMTQVKLPAQAKLELARNYWDEMGRGSLAGMHGLLLDGATKGLSLEPTIDDTAWQSLALANTLTAFATTRRYAYQSVGALGVVELTAPGRVAQVAAGLKQLDCPPATRKYFALHAVLDVQHSEQWNEEALKPLVAERPDCAAAIAEGALIRLECGRRCFEAYRAALWG